MSIVLKRTRNPVGGRNVILNEQLRHGRVARGNLTPTLSQNRT